MTANSPTQICFYCFQSYRTEDAHWICPKCYDVDPQMEEILGLTAPAPLRFDDASSLGLSPDGEGICPKCKSPTPRRACPRCHGEIHKSTGDSGEMVSVVGATTSGKSVYICSLLQRVMNEPGRCLERYGAVMNQHSNEMFANLARQMFTDGVFPDPTPPGEISEPIVSEFNLKYWRIDFGGLGAFWRSLVPRKGIVPLVFYDFAGEKFADEGGAATPYMRYCARASAIIIAVDPAALPAAEMRRGAERHAPDDIAYRRLDPNELCRNVTFAIRSLNRSARGGATIDKPVAIMLLKADELPALDDVLAEKADRMEKSGSEQRFDLSMVEKHHETCVKLLNRWGAGGLVDNISQNYRSYKVFPVMAARRKHGSATEVTDPFEALGVEEPLYWLLCELGYFRF